MKKRLTIFNHQQTAFGQIEDELGGARCTHGRDKIDLKETGSVEFQ
jgi:hypothetical protein